jgi:hypothetical protein
VLLGGGTTLIIAFNNQNSTETSEEQAARQRVAEAKARAKGKESYLKEVALTEEFKTGDQITVPYGEDKYYKIEVGPIEKDAVTFLLPDEKKIRIPIEKSEILELGSGSDAKLRMNLNNISALGGLNSRINLSLTKLGAQMSPLEAGSNVAAADQPQASLAPGQSPVPTITTQAAPNVTAQPPVAIANDQTVIASNDQPKLFVVKAEFNNSCYLRCLIDGKTIKEQFFQKNSNLLIDTAYSSVKIWASNGGAVKLKVEGQDLSLGRQGQVVTKLIKWVKEGDSNKYKLVITSTP